MGTRTIATMGQDSKLDRRSAGVNMRRLGDARQGACSDRERRKSLLNQGQKRRKGFGVLVGAIKNIEADRRGVADR